MVRDAVAAGADSIMLDNMNHDKIKTAMEYIAGSAEDEFRVTLQKKLLPHLPILVLTMFRVEH